MTNLCIRKHLEDALVVARINEREKGDAGEVARVLHQLSLAYEITGEAQNYGNEADRIYKELIATGEYARTDIGQGKWDYLVCLKFR